MLRALAAIDRYFDRVYGQRFNPLYQSGVLAIIFLLVVIVTGFYLLYFYKISAPYDSVMGTYNQIYAGRWIHTLHRYASNAAMLAIFLHIIRMFIQGRTSGARAATWIGGVVLTGFVLFSGWTGMILVWDLQGQVLAIEGARLIDLVPIFSEPISRIFSSNVNMPSSFFFLNLFLHLSLPLGVTFALWYHTSRLARPKYFPHKTLTRWSVGILILAAVLWPAVMGAEANMLKLPGKIPLNWFYNFWLPSARHLPPWLTLLLWSLLIGLLMSIPWWWRPNNFKYTGPSHVHESSCTGCTTCYHDCPYNAISMVKRSVGHGSELVAHVDPKLCVSCGICAASCAPMGVGPRGKTGKEQLHAAREFAARNTLSGHLVLMACRQTRLSKNKFTNTNLVFYPSDCSGSTHTSVVELFVKEGALGVGLITCPPRNCLNREGPLWLEERLFQGHEADLRPTVDKRRIRLTAISPGDNKSLNDFTEKFLKDLKTLEATSLAKNDSLERECEIKNEQP